MPFAAELMAIDLDQRRWEATAEMVLRPFALSLLVPERYYRRVCAYVDCTKLTDEQGEGHRRHFAAGLGLKLGVALAE